MINKEVDFIATNAEEKRYIQATESMNKPTTREREHPRAGTGSTAHNPGQLRAFVMPSFMVYGFIKTASGMKTGDGCIWVSYLNEIKHKLDFFDKL